MDSEEGVRKFEKALSQMVGLQQQIAALSQKKPNDALNKFKLDLVNDLLGIANKYLGEELRPFPRFEVFDEETMPSNSDVAIMLDQYLSRLREFRESNSEQDARYHQCWLIKGRRSTIEVSHV